MGRLTSALVVTAGLASITCGGGGGSAPSAPVPVATPTPVAVATPTPTPAAPSPEPTTCPNGPCENFDRETKPVRITLRLFVVVEPSGSVFQYSETADGTPIIPVNYKFAIDIIAKDKKNKETRGSGQVKWTWDENMVEVEKFTNIYHPTLRATKGGRWCATAELDEITSNELCLEFRY